MNKRLKTGLVALGLTVIAVPAIGAARTHYTGKVPPSIMEPADVLKTAMQPGGRVLTRWHKLPAANTVAVHKASHVKTSHKNLAAAKHKAVKKHHKHAAKKSAI